MKGPREIKTVVHWPDAPAARASLYHKMQGFYIGQVEKRLEELDLSREQKLAVLDRLIERGKGGGTGA